MENPNLPDELIIEILTRLPVKSLLRFKCASKSWIALISSSEFVKKHLSLCSSNEDDSHHKLLLTKNRYCSGPSAYSSQYDNLNNSWDPKHCSLNSFFSDNLTEAFDLEKYPLEDVWVTHSVNGLICLEISHDFFLWNPSVRKLKKLPDSTHTRESGYGISFKYGFGYDESSDDYKIVGISDFFRGYRFHHTEVNIYSTKSGSWRCKDNFPCALIYAKMGKFAKGKLHWINNANRVLNIAFIDLADENWGKLELPYYGQGNRVVLEVLRNDLCVFYENPSDVWVMKEYGVRESWTKLYTIKHPQHLLNQMHFPSYFMSNKGQIGVKIGLTFMIYSPKDNSLRYSKEVAEDDSLRYSKEVINYDGYGHAVVYVESLVWPFPIEGAEVATKTNAGRAKIT